MATERARGSATFPGLKMSRRTAVQRRARGSELRGWCLSFNIASRREGYSCRVCPPEARGALKGRCFGSELSIYATNRLATRFSPPRLRPAQARLATPSIFASSRRCGKAGAELGRGALDGALGMLGRAGSAGLRAASRKPSTLGGCGREREGERDGPRSWAHVPRGLMPRVSQPDVQLASASAVSRHRLLALRGCRGEELQP